MRLKIVLVDSEPERAQALEKQLAEAGFADVVRVASGPDLTGAVERIAPDLVIVDMALPDRDALEDIRAVSGEHPIVMFAGSDDPAFVEDAIAAGVCSYNLSGAADVDVRPIVTSAIALFRRYQRVKTELDEARAMLDERRLIERAKAILMRNRKMSEPEAYGWLRRRAMNANKKIAHIAADLVRKEEASRAPKSESPSADGETE
jgi:two-component system, response regulator / RNA-binding antiterminator